MERTRQKILFVDQKNYYYHRLYQVAISKKFADNHKTWPLWVIHKLIYMTWLVFIQEILRWKKSEKY